ncbi:U3 small nucleolar RNA-associated protein NOL7 [Hoplias malabaricus]|uniref:U3 small nucleolar RNA-associated protein NOL7 n=1 Tax=Hoplias malabaricus TaxID=27720 RepID=UPI003462B42F
MARLQHGSPQSAEETGEFEAVTERRDMSDHSEEDDEGPEEVGFEESRSTALKSVQEAIKAIRREKELLKEKRRKRQLLFQEQKKKRLLPETLLEEFDTVPQKKKKPSVDKEEEEEENVEKEVEEETEEVSETKSTEGSKSLQGNCNVMRVKDESSDASLQQTAMDFVQSRLYGPGTKRTTNAERLSLEKKRGASKGAAAQFVNKKWGAELKAKAEKCNKRFIHKKKLIPS